MDIGPCPKSHSPKLLDEYQQALQKGHPGFLDDWFRNLSDFVADCDRKVAAAQKRLDKTPEDAKAVELVWLSMFGVVKCSQFLNVNV